MYIHVDVKLVTHTMFLFSVSQRDEDFEIVDLISVVFFVGGVHIFIV